MHEEHHHDPHGEGHQADGGQLDKILSTHTRLGFHQDTALPTLRLYQLYVCVRGGERRIYFSLVSYRLSRIACLYSGEESDIGTKEPGGVGCFEMSIGPTNSEL